MWLVVVCVQLTLLKYWCSDSMGSHTHIYANNMRLMSRKSTFYFFNLSALHYIKYIVVYKIKDKRGHILCTTCNIISKTNQGTLCWSEELPLSTQGGHEWCTQNYTNQCKIDLCRWIQNNDGAVYANHI